MTTLRVHYPAGAHAVTLRGSTAPLDWSAGRAMTPGADDTWTFTTTALVAPAEWKPLLDDATWARGPNWRVAPGDTVDAWPHFTASKGTVVTLFPSLHSQLLGNDRAVYAYLPAGYDEDPRAAYPVVYMHDGQNLFDPALAFGGHEWRVDETFDAAAESGACSSATEVGWAAQPFDAPPTLCTGDGDCASGSCRTFPPAIVVGPANTDARTYEYTPTPDPTYPGGGGGDLYLRFLVEELKPRVDSMLRTQPGRASTFLIGSSLGGLISAYAGCTQPTVWGGLGVMSPTTWWDMNVIVSDVVATAPDPVRPLRVYVDSGTVGAEDGLDGWMETAVLAQAYAGVGYVDGKTLRHVVQQGADHDEVYWAERLPGALQFLLGER